MHVYNGLTLMSVARMLRQYQALVTCDIHRHCGCRDDDDDASLVGCMLPVPHACSSG